MALTTAKVDMDSLLKRVADEGSEPETWKEYLHIITERMGLLEVILGRRSPNLMVAITLPDPDLDAASIASTACAAKVPALSCIPCPGMQDIICVHEFQCKVWSLKTCKDMDSITELINTLVQQKALVRVFHQGSARLL